MKKVFTMKELEARYSAEWVLLINPKHIEQLERLRGELVFHSKDRSEVYKEANKRKDAHTAIFYVGKLPEDFGGCALKYQFDPKAGTGNGDRLTFSWRHDVCASIE